MREKFCLREDAGCAALPSFKSAAGAVQKCFAEKICLGPDGGRGEETIKRERKHEIFSVTLLRKRLFAVAAAIAFLFLLIFARFFQVQVAEGEKLRYRALDQWTREIPIVAERGRITDVNGELLADNVPSYTVFVRPNAVKDKDATAAALASVFGTDAAALAERLRTAKVSEITLARRISKEKADELDAYDLPGVYFFAGQYARLSARQFPFARDRVHVGGQCGPDGAGKIL